MARKTGTKTEDRKFRGFARIVKDVDREALRKLAERLDEIKRAMTHGTEGHVPLQVGEATVDKNSKSDFSQTAPRPLDGVRIPGKKAARKKPPRKKS